MCKSTIIFLYKLLIVIFIIPLLVEGQVPIKNLKCNTINDRIIQLEQKNYAHSQYLNKLQQLCFDNQKEIDDLRGQIQENQHKLSQVIEKQDKIYQYLNLLINEKNTISVKNKSINKKNNLNKKKPDTVDKVFHSSNNKKEESDYNHAVSLVLINKQYDQAIVAFQAFIKNYHNSIYQPNAHYWLGQLYFNKNKKDEASYHFALVAKKYPKSEKAPDALLKIGIIMQEKGQTETAKVIYKQVGKLYPNSEAAKQIKKLLKNI